MTDPNGFSDPFMLEFDRWSPYLQPAIGVLGAVVGIILTYFVRRTGDQVHEGNSETPGAIPIPVLLTPDPVRLRSFYIDRLGFVPIVHDGAGELLEETALARHGVRLVFRRAEVPGLLVNTNVSPDLGPGIQTTLFLASRDPDADRSDMRRLGAEAGDVVTELALVKEYFRGFLVTDPDGRRLFFCKNEHYPHAPSVWSWKQRIKAKPAIGKIGPHKG